MKAWAVTFLMALLPPAAAAAAPATPVGGRIDRPALRSRHTEGVELLTSAQLADDLEATALNLRDLAYFRFRAWDGTLPQREKEWAFQRMVEESKQQRLLDRYAAAALPGGSVLEGPPEDQAWHMPFPADREGERWEAGRRLSNEGLVLARRVRAAAAAEILARARASAE